MYPYSTQQWPSQPQQPNYTHQPADYQQHQPGQYHSQQPAQYAPQSPQQYSPQSPPYTPPQSQQYASQPPQYAPQQQQQQQQQQPPPPPPLQQAQQQYHQPQMPPQLHQPPQFQQPPPLQQQPPSLQQAHQPQYTHQPPYYPNLAQPPKQKLDQHAMPSAVQLISDEIDTYKQSDRQLKFTAPASLPPLVTTLESQQLKMSLLDAGCVRPCHMRSTIYQIPTSKDILESSGLEFALVIKPFDEGEVDGKFYTPLSMSEIVRCTACKAYISPFAKNTQLCICKRPMGGVQEMDQKPELHLGSYEFRATAEYHRTIDGQTVCGETRRPHIIFAIEMTVNSRHLIHYISKHLAAVIKDHFPKDFLYSASLSPLVGFVTYNSRITIYDVMNGGHAYVLSDLTSVTDSVPTSNFLVNPAKNFEEIEKFLSSLPELCEEQIELEQQTILGPVIEAALKTCLFDITNLFQGNPNKPPNPKVVPAGKIYVLHSSLPTYGDDTTPGKLGAKRNIEEMKRSLGTDTESKTFAVEGKYYSKLAEKCYFEYASGVELFLFPPHPRAYLNIATLGELAKLTGTGVINKYQINSLDDFIQDLKISLKSTMGFDAQMKVRTSIGISPVNYIGNFRLPKGTDVEMGAVSTNSNFIVQMRYDDKLPENDLVFVQFAILYTSVCGERRVRVHNLALSTCSILADLYKSACCDTIMNVLIRETVDKVRSGSLAPKVAKEYLTTRVITILAAYRKHCTENHSSTSSQLILPEGLKLLPVYLCGALKCDAIDGGMEMFPDDKILAQLNLIGALPSESQVTVYPRMYSIEACEADDESNEYGLQAILTRCYNLAIEEAKGQCYILENGYYLFIFFPSTELGQSLLASVFGTHKDDPALDWNLRQRDANESKFIEELLVQIVAERRRALKISVVRQRIDKMESVFRTFLYEDKKRPDGVIATSKLDNASYVDLLCYLHTEIRSKLSH